MCPSRDRLEFWAVWILVRGLGTLPRPGARTIGSLIGSLAFRVFARLRSVGAANLKLAFPEATKRGRAKVLHSAFRHLGRHLAEFCLMRGYSRSDLIGVVEYEGIEHYLSARDAGKGVMVLTGHLGAWELSSFFHSLMGYPMGLVIRRLDNPLVDTLVNEIRCLHGNKVLPKDDFARGLISAMRSGETVGILMDTNMTPPQGVFVPFFGVEACTASGMARIAIKTGAAVLPGFLVWDAARAKYLLQFGERIPLVKTGDHAQDVVANTALFTKAIEAAIVRHPDQWLWMHRRWKTRPEGQVSIY